MFSRTLFLVSALTALLASTAAYAAAPAMIPMQGYVTNADGTPLTGPHAFEVSVFADSVGGSALFTDQQMVDVDEGYFTFYVGRGDALDLALFRDNGTLFLGVTIDDDMELSPRTELATVPYAAYAEYAGTVDFTNIANLPADLADGDAVLQAGSGLIDTSGVIDVDTTTIQARVTGTCATGEAISAVNVDGTVVCSPASSYAAGAGLSLNANTFAIDTAIVQSRVVGTCGANQKMLGVNLDGTVNCGADLDTDTDTTYAAGAGLGLVGTTFSVNTSAIQARVGASCPAGQSIRAIAADGSVTCEVDTDTDTTYVGGNGIVLTGTSFSVNTNTIQARVSSTCPAGQSIRAIAANGTVTCEVDTDTDTDTTYTAGTGLNLVGTTFNMNVTGRYSTAPTSGNGSPFNGDAASWLGLRFRIDGGGPSGRLEITNDDGTTWGTVCDDGFNDHSARVVCRAMGYSTGSMVVNTSTTDGVDPILLDEFSCGPESRNLMECTVRQIGTHNCTHPEDVGVTCVL